MRRFTQIFLSLAVVLTAVSCASKEEYGVVKEIDITATTNVIQQGDIWAQHLWKGGEQIRVFSTVSPTPARFTITSGVNSDVATFKGTINTQASYWGVRPADALQNSSSQSITISTSEAAVDWSIDNVLAKIPQLGRSSGKNQLEFSPIFGIVAIPISLENTNSINTLGVSVASDCHALYGTYGYGLNTNAVVTTSGTREETITFAQPEVVGTTPKWLYIALPQGNYSELQITIAGGGTGGYNSFKAKSFNVKEGKVTEVANPETGYISYVVGDWRLSSFRGKEADINVFISMRLDNTFTLYQSADKLGYTTFTGEWAYDEAANILSGIYSDGTEWGASYYVSLTESGDLCLTNTANSEEVSIYTKSEMPTVSTAGSRAVNVKPFL